MKNKYELFSLVKEFFLVHPGSELWVCLMLHFLWYDYFSAPKE